MNFLFDENGQGLVEYGIIIGLIAIVCVVLLVAFGDRIYNNFKDTNDAFDEVSKN